jgi:septation ring formation regulator EzrA
VKSRASADSGQASETRSHDATGRESAPEPNATSRARGGGDFSGGELKAAVSAATAQLTQDLHAVGNLLSSIETGHRGLTERLQRIAEQADERALHQFGSLQEQIEEARKQILSAREDHEVARTSFLDQLQVIRDQYESSQQQFHATDQRFKGIEQQLHIVEDGVRATEEKHDSVEQRLQASQQKHLDAERNWQRTDDWLQTTRNQLESVEQQLQATVQQLQEFQQQLSDAGVRLDGFGTQFQEFQQQLADADGRIKNLEPEIKRSEERLERNAQSQFADIKRIVDEDSSHRKNLQISFGEIVHDVNQLRTYLPRLTGDDEQIQSLHALLRSSRRMQRFAVAASIVSLLAVVYIGLGKPGWPTIAQYVSSWLPGLGFR